jgi:hypothetical protein
MKLSDTLRELAERKDSYLMCSAELASVRIRLNAYKSDAARSKASLQLELDVLKQHVAQSTSIIAQTILLCSQIALACQAAATSDAEEGDRREQRRDADTRGREGERKTANEASGYERDERDCQRLPLATDSRKRAATQTIALAVVVRNEVEAASVLLRLLLQVMQDDEAKRQMDELEKRRVTAFEVRKREEMDELEKRSAIAPARRARQVHESPHAFGREGGAGCSKVGPLNLTQTAGRDSLKRQEAYAEQERLIQ